MAVVWLSIIAAITSFSVGKWLPTARAIARFVLLGLFTISVIIYAVKNGATAGASSYSPSARRFVLLVACCCSTSSASICPTAQVKK